MRLSSLAAAVALAAVIMSARGPLEAQGVRRGANYFPNLPVVTQDGKTLRFYDDVIKDKIVLISFAYTNCPDICPLTTARIAQVEDKLGDMVGRDIFFVSMTVDPERDTPERLKEFANAFDAGPGWLFLTGKPEDIRLINSRLGDRSRTLSEHRNEIVLGNDATGEWTRNTVFGDIDRLIMDIRAMDPKWRAEVREPKFDAASNTGYAVDHLQPGQAMFKKICAPCHTIGVGDRVGPDLRGVNERRQHEWLTRFIRTPDKVLAEKDPIALTLAAKFPGARMPNLKLSESDAADLISYIGAQTSLLADGPQGAPASNQQYHHH
ncbi:MAG TPA: SCO family protein [Xanthobacteraceae bacterium]|nr:SCO family protein [Xanthobacteraceae bacterium]